MPSFSLSRAGFCIFYDSLSSRGASDPSPGGRLFEAPARRVGHRRPFFRRGHRGPMCGAGVARSWRSGGSGGARESQLFLGYVNKKIFSKIHLDIIITTTATEHYQVYNKEKCVLFYIAFFFPSGGSFSRRLGFRARRVLVVAIGVCTSS